MRVIRKRRRRENKTDYKMRINLLKSQIQRIVFRKSNRYIIGQVVEMTRDVLRCRMVDCGRTLAQVTEAGDPKFAPGWVAVDGVWTIGARALQREHRGERPMGARGARLPNGERWPVSHEAIFPVSVRCPDCSFRSTYTTAP